MVFGTLVLVGCASNIMKAYEGKTIVDVILDYGPPLTAFDMGDGRRGFMWAISQTYSLPAHASTTGNVSVYGNQAFYSSSTLVAPAASVSQTCNYTMFATRIAGGPDGPAGWRVVGYAPPRLSCE